MKNFYDLRVKDVMNSFVWDMPLIESNADIRTVLLIIISRCYVWVVKSTESMEMVGVITEHDFLKMFQKFDPDATAEDFATKDIIYCTMEESVGDVMEKIRKYNVRRLPVLENGKLVGEVTLRNLIGKFYSLVS